MTSSPYLPAPVVTDQPTILSRLLADLAALQPGWSPTEADVETALLQVVAGSEARLTALLASVTDGLYRALGKDWFGIAPLQGAPARMHVTFTVTGPLVTVPAGTRVRASTVDGRHVFATDETVVSTGTEVAVSAVALAVGQAANSATGVQLADAVPGVVSVTQNAPASGGADPETDDAYRDRVASILPRRRATPHFADEFAAAARDVPGVRRAFAIAGYDATVDEEVGGAISVYPVDEEGLDVPLAVEHAVLQALSDPDQRALNVLVRVAKPTRTPVAVEYEATAAPGYDPTDVQGQVHAAVRAWLHPARWAGGDLEPPDWTSDRLVRIFDVARVIQTVDGVQHIDSLLLDGQPADVVLPGRVPLPAHPQAAVPSTVTGQVVAG